MVRCLFTAVLALLAIGNPCAAQSSSAATTADPSQTSPPASSDTNSKTSSAKKVWTNDNLAHAGGKVSVVGDNRNQKYTVTPAKPADPATVSKIRENLKKLQTQLDGINQQLSALKDFQEGETVTKSSDDIPQGYTRVPVNQQIPVLQEKKKKLEAQIDELLDEARKKGIEPGQLR
jgi:uncharacterized protein YukE